MEATKKKKAYLKPEMSAFEVKTQEFIAGSKHVEEEDFTKEEFQAIPPCLVGGGQSFIKNYKVNDCFNVNKQAYGNECLSSLPSFNLIPKETYKIIKIGEDGTVYVKLASKCLTACGEDEPNIDLY